MSEIKMINPVTGEMLKMREYHAHAEMCAIFDDLPPLIEINNDTEVEEKASTNHSKIMTAYGAGNIVNITPTINELDL